MIKSNRKLTTAGSHVLLPRVSIRSMLLVALFAICGTAQSQPLDSLVGLWESPDGNSRQQFIDEFPGLLATKTWFRIEGNWKLVGQGFLYRRPGSPAWTGASRTTNMGGMELFESVITPLGEGQFSVHNKSYDTTGAVTLTAEDWSVENEDVFTYKIYKVTGDERELWMEGRWVRLGEASE